MTEKQNKIAKLLWDFESLRENQMISICDCDRNDIDWLVAKNIICRDNNKNILYHKLRRTNNRNVVAFDVVLEYLDRCTNIKKAKYPINVSFDVNNIKYDIIAIKEVEIDKLYNDIDNISQANKVIIIIESSTYVKRKINTKREFLICIYYKEKINIVDKLN